MGFRISHCKYNERLIDIRHRRADQLILPRKNLYDIPGFLCLIEYFDLHFVPDKRFHLFFSEHAPGFTLIKTGFYYVNIVESGNSFYNLSLHIVICQSHSVFLLDDLSSVEPLPLLLLPEDPPLSGVLGTIGTTSGPSLVWKSIAVPRST